MKNLLYGVAPVLIALLVMACNRGPYAAANKAYKKQAKQFSKNIQQTPANGLVTGTWVGTTNFNMRKPNFVIIHHTAQNSCEQTLKTFTDTATKVSAHYVICKDGTIYHMLNDYLRAWHGGVGKWGNTTDINSSSIGIEIDNNGFEVFTDAQITSLLTTLSTLKRTYAIPTPNFIGHSDIAPTRKVDPNVHFPWKKLSESGFGIWWSDTTNVTVPANFSTVQALRIIGYDIKDSVAAIKVFKRKFLQQDNNAQVTEADRKVLYTLYKKVE